MDILTRIPGRRPRPLLGISRQAVSIRNHRHPDLAMEAGGSTAYFKREGTSHE
jgi:hypothetical protein